MNKTKVTKLYILNLPMTGPELTTIVAALVRAGEHKLAKKIVDRLPKEVK